jgi:hypothetical protein
MRAPMSRAFYNCLGKSAPAAATTHTAPLYQRETASDGIQIAP